jgi:hypothetical protein
MDNGIVKDRVGNFILCAKLVNFQCHIHPPTVPVIISTLHSNTP